jgi:hypothetical protein
VEDHALARDLIPPYRGAMDISNGTTRPMFHVSL